MKLFNINSYNVLTTTFVHQKHSNDFKENNTNFSTGSKNVTFSTDVKVFHYRYKKQSVYQQLLKLYSKNLKHDG